MTEGETEGLPLPPGQRRSPRWRPSTYGRVPRLDPEAWTLTVTGATRGGGVHVLDRDDLDPLGTVDVGAGLHCVDRHSVTGLRWSGWRLRDVVAIAPPQEGVEHVLLVAARGYAAAVLVEDLLHPDALLATHVDGEPLTPEHGWPVRVVLPHLYGFKGPKWVVEVVYSHERPQGYWESHGYHPRGRVALEERWGYQA
ncbi:molybdopterin-dependent oxidoreductase [Ornithinimicrobium cerasi]|uniref:DMSO/TMAO reductase YedYZ, molybdopterin-dependent catalytic subunit n=1 Tax=Ornithinimicrobium cerasi TaxID=2248773 RepID=A0A285VCF4_9MICO|nr:molybdopterin-dependent oxidoreductase [Ornithinimicrobium cerasi]SOC51647.1 DMSO/TMAO reductase YedYZ, molybdopterin-dependent catalytic subunit [Ornithinimicrobium cerasi]